MFEDLVVINKYPDDTWLTRLRRGNVFWLVKEKQFGIVEWEFEPTLGYSSGRIGFRRHDNFWKNETWMVRPDGKGINYSQLFLPVEGHLPKNTLSLPEPEIRQLLRQVGALTQRVEQLEIKAQYSYWIEPYDLIPTQSSVVSSESRCSHDKCEVAFDDEKAAEMTVQEIRKVYPRFSGTCPDCNVQVIKYASGAHYHMGDW